MLEKHTLALSIALALATAPGVHAQTAPEADADRAGFYGGVALRSDGGDRQGLSFGHLTSVWSRFALPVAEDGGARSLAYGCAAPDNDLAVEAGAQPPGFWLGLWHGIIAPITLIISWFSDTVGIYAVRNRGGWYDFGFMLGVSIVFGGSRGPGAYRGRRRPRRSEND